MEKEPKVWSPMPVARVVLFAAGVWAGPATAAERTGTLCVVPVAAHNDGDTSLANPTGGNPPADYTIQLDDRPVVPVRVFDQPHATSGKGWIRRYPEGTLLSDVAVGARHTVVVRRRDKAVESFRFRLSTRDPDQCLFLKEFYLTWNLWPKRSTPWCKCTAPQSGRSPERP